MIISESQFTNARPQEALDANEKWLRHEAPEQEPERGHTPEGLPYVGFDQLIDGVHIVSRFTARESGDGTLLTFTFSTEGQGILGKIRNLGMLAARKHIRSASQHQFEKVLEYLEDSDFLR